MRKLFELVGEISVNGLAGVQQGLQNLELQMSKADKAFAKFARQTEKIGTTLSKTITLPIAAVSTAIAAATVKTGQYADKILDLNQITGLSTDALQEYENVAREAGVNFDGFVGTITKLSNSLPEIIKGTGPAANALEKLGVNIKDSTGHVEKMDNLFPKILDKLRSVENITERNALAQDIFGKSLTDLAPVLGMTSEEMDRARKNAHDLGLVMSGDSLAAANEFRKKVEQLKGQFDAFVRSIGSEFIPLLEELIPIIQSKVVPAIKEFISRISDTVKWFLGLDSTTKKIIAGFGAFVVVAGPAILMTGKIITVFRSLVATVTLARTAILGLTAAMATNPFTAVIVGAGLLITSLLGVKTAFDLAREARDKYDDKQADSESEKKMLEFRQSMDLLADKMVQYQTDVNDSIESNKLFGNDIEELSKKANALGWVVEGSLSERFRTLTQILAGNTSELEIYDARVEALKRKMAGMGTGGGTSTEAEKKAREELAQTWKTQAMEIGKTELELNELRRNMDLEKARSTKATAETIDNINKFYDAKKDELIEKEMEKIVENAETTVDIEKDKKEKISEIEKYYADAVFEQSNSRISILEKEKEEAIRLAKEKGAETANIEIYYDKLIAEAKAEAQKEKAMKFLDDMAMVGGQIEAIWSQAYQNNSIALDNWYAKEKSNIESSITNQEEREKRMEQLDVEYDKKLKKLKHDQAVKEKTFAIFSSIINTAAAVVKSLPNIALSTFVGALGAIETGLIAAQPIPFGRGGLVKRKENGIQAVVGEGSENELVLPMETGTEILAKNLMHEFWESSNQGTTVTQRDIHIHVGTMIADEGGLKELNRRLSKYQIMEATRLGAI